MGDRIYRAAPAGDLRIEALGELTAIFDRRSMQTHLVVSPMPEILDVMGAESCDARAIAGRLAERFDIEADGDAPAIIAERLIELSAMGLAGPA